MVPTTVISRNASRRVDCPRSSCLHEPTYSVTFLMQQTTRSWSPNVRSLAYTRVHTFESLAGVSICSDYGKTAEDLFFAWEAKSFSGRDKTGSAIMKEFAFEDAMTLRKDIQTEVLKKQNQQQRERLRQSTALSRRKGDASVRSNKLAMGSSALSKPLQPVRSGRLAVSFKAPNSGGQQKCAFCPFPGCLCLTNGLEQTVTCTKPSTNVAPVCLLLCDRGSGFHAFL